MEFSCSPSRWKGRETDPRTDDTDGGEGRRDHNDDDDGRYDFASLDEKILLSLGNAIFIDGVMG